MVCHAVELCALLYISQILVNSSLLLGCGELLHELALRCENHEGHAEDGVGTGGEDGELDVAVFHCKLHLCSFRASDPVFLCLLYRVAPVDGVKTVEQALRVGTCAQAPLAHLLLHHGVAATLAHAVHHLVVGQHGTQTGAPVDHRLAKVGYAIVHERLLLLYLAHVAPLVSRKLERFALGHVQTLGALLLEMFDELLYGLRLLARVAEERLEHLLKGPLCPVIIFRVAGAHLAAPVERESDLVELLAVAVDVGHGCYLRVLSCLYGILLSGQTVGIVAHGV